MDSWEGPTWIFCPGAPEFLVTPLGLIVILVIVVILLIKIVGPTLQCSVEMFYILTNVTFTAWRLLIKINPVNVYEGLPYAVGIQPSYHREGTLVMMMTFSMKVLKTASQQQWQLVSVAAPGQGLPRRPPWQASAPPWLSPWLRV